MRYFAGGDLYKNLETITELELVTCIKQIAAVLVKLHGMDPPIYHNDVKPDNIMLHKDGGIIEAYLVDYGLATETYPSVHGTKGYIDHVLHKADEGSVLLEHDTYGICIILKEYITYLDFMNLRMTNLTEPWFRTTNFNRKLLNVTDKYVEMCKNIEDKYVEMCKNIEDTAIYDGIYDCLSYLDDYLDTITKFEVITKLLYIYSIRGSCGYLKNSDVEGLNIMEHWDELLTVFEKYRSRCGLHKLRHNFAIALMINKFNLDSEKITAWKTGTVKDTNTLIDNYESVNASFENMWWLTGSQEKQLENNNKSLRLLKRLISRLE